LSFEKNLLIAMQIPCRRPACGPLKTCQTASKLAGETRILVFNALPTA
jgi:hypothetical protein